MKKEQRIMAWTALHYYIEMAEKNREEALKLEDGLYWANYWEEQRNRAKEAQEAVLKRR